MRLSSFEVRSQRSIRWAKCEQAPALMVIAGPNGVGKSTLLNFLRTSYGANNILYVGPHRSLRRQVVQQRHLYLNPILYKEVLSRPDIISYEGIQLYTGVRDAWGYDDSANYLKHALCQIEVERQQAIAKRYDRDGEIPRGTVADPWNPLRELTYYLLPHLQFARIDASNRDQVRCLWKIQGSDVEIDLDDLSSGEKSIIQMFYPIIEPAIRGLMTDTEGDAPGQPRTETCILVDEPELHLHPNLQYKVLDYFRQLTADGQTQVILATQSPMIVEAATFDELFLLRPAELIGSNENQLVQIASDEERLHLLRHTFGTTANITAMQPILIIEGVSEDNVRHVSSDRKIYRRLHPGFDRVSVICGGGKGECKKLLEHLHAALPSFSPRLRAVALLDRDTSERQPSDERVHLLPVSMIENFLLDPDCLWQAVESIVEKTPFRSVRDVESALDSILDALEEEEIDRRARATLGIEYFRPTSLRDLSDQADVFANRLQERYSPQVVALAVEHATIKVRELRQIQRRREEFDGKAVLKAFYKEYLHRSGMPREIFTYETARYASKRACVQNFFENFFVTLL